MCICIWSICICVHVCMCVWYVSQERIIHFLMSFRSQLQCNAAQKNTPHFIQDCPHLDSPHSLNPFRIPYLCSLIVSASATKPRNHPFSVQRSTLPFSSMVWLLDWEKWQTQGDTKEEDSAQETSPHALGSMRNRTQIRDKRRWCSRFANSPLFSS